ncbi:unnamed protein product [Candida verbasci]|uniref:Putative tRNA (cytidine(32)/guanosine(34)-2'-O)-methyltransferase n=1 Tax=Candida verbasci TaxID=1227364 RepID=A0A9W4TXC3_9ASCO|nr:unnamed protein product [Candida verbasci]
MGKTSKDKRDLYYRRAKEEGWRARSAFKLLQLNDEFNLFDGIKNVVDLCAAPGSWSQVLSQKLPEDSKIIAVDLQPMTPIDNVVTLQADITHPKTLTTILHHFNGELADFICSDGAPDITGLHDLDEYIQSQLILSALQLSICLLKPGGKFIAKIFRGKDIDLLYSQLSNLFEQVICAKPKSSRSTSLEAFVVCLGYKPLPGWKPKLDLNKSTEDFFSEIITDKEFDIPEETRKMVKFISCGDINDIDSDATYNNLDKLTLDPIQKPTAPPYKKALEMRRNGEFNRRL